MWEEFKKFALKGNVIDLAIGVIIGGAFGKIVASLVNDIIMPLLGLITGGINFTEAKWVIREAVGEVTPELSLNYGQFLQNIIDFFIIALSIFMVIRLFNRFKKKEEKQEEAPVEPEPTKEQLLLTEIRDVLKEQGSHRNNA
ncbi:MAG: large-conductance mechanosensitive channel protein MscL [Caldicoprobacterales bacterium]|jgi:large conductance mechanosensitive channel|nr:large-conductance mechanosensitive channel protein MscL [Clostridiales bacterium]